MFRFLLVSYVFFALVGCGSHRQTAQSENDLSAIHFDGPKQDLGLSDFIGYSGAKYIVLSNCHQNVTPELGPNCSGTSSDVEETTYYLDLMRREIESLPKNKILLNYLSIVKNSSPAAAVRRLDQEISTFSTSDSGNAEAVAPYLEAKSRLEGIKEIADKINGGEAIRYKFDGFNEANGATEAPFELRIFFEPDFTSVIERVKGYLLKDKSGYFVEVGGHRLDVKQTRETSGLLGTKVYVFQNTKTLKVEFVTNKSVRLN